MNNYLQGLPFNIGQGKSSDCDCPGQAFDPEKFKLYTQSDRLPSFVLRLPPQGANPDITYAGECVRIFTCDLSDMVANLTQDETGVKIFKDDASYYVTYDGSKINGINLECGKCYRIKIMNFWSESFWVTDTPQSKIQLEFTNKSQIGDVPYQKPLFYVNRIMIDGEMCALPADIFQNKKTDANGNETVTFQRLTKQKALYIYNAPSFIQELIGSIEMHDSFKVIHKGETFEPLQRRSKPESTENGCCDYDIKITMALSEIKLAGGICQTDAQGELEEVDIPDDIPDTCTIDDDYLPTNETLCLKDGEVPPVILPPITPVGTPPVGAPCPPNGTVVNSSTLSVDCTNAFIFEGVKYKKKVTKIIANGNCGSTEEVQYLEQCDADATTHTISNVVCQSVVPVPPVGTPPVGTPPVGTPPPTSGDTMEMSLYFDDSGSSAMKARVIGQMPIGLKVYNEGNTEMYSTSTSISNEVAIPDSVLSALGNQTMRVVSTDALNKTATRTMSKIVRDRNSIVHAFISVPNGDTNNHKDAINKGQNVTPPLTMTAVIFGQLNTDADYNAYKNSTFQNSSSSPYAFDTVIALAKTKANCKRIKVGIGLCRDSSKLNNGSTITHALGIGDLVMRVDGVTPTSKPWLIGQMILSPGSTNARAYAKRQAEAFVRHNYAPIMDGTISFIGLPIGPSGEAEYPTSYHNDQGQDEPGSEVRGDFHPENVARFKSRYPQYASVNNQQLYDQFHSGNALSLAWKEHHGFIYAEFEAEVFEHIYSIYPEMRTCQFEQIDVGSDTDFLAPRRHTLNIRRRIRPTTGIMKTNDNPHGGTRMDFIMDHDTSLAKIYGCVVAAEPSPQNANFADPEVRGQVLSMMQDMYERGVSMSFYDPTQSNIQYFLSNTQIVPGSTPKAKLDYGVAGSNKIHKRLSRNLSDIFKTGAFGGWETAWANYKSTQGLTHVDTLSNDDLFPGLGTPPVGTPPVGTPPPSGPLPPSVGAYTMKVGGRNWTFSKAPKFNPVPNTDGTLTDMEPGLDRTGSVAKQDGDNVFYCADYDYIRNEDGTSSKFQNLYLPDGIYCLRKFVMNPTKFPNQAAFEANESDTGYDTEGVNQKNGYVAEVFISVSSDVKQGTGIVPNWLVVSRICNFTDYSPNQDWASYNKFAAVTWMNKSDTQAQLIQKGVLPNTLLGQGVQRKTWLTFKNAQNQVMTAQQHHDQGRAIMGGLLGGDPRSIFTSEYIENEQGQGPGNEFFRTAQEYDGAFEVITETFPGTNVLNTGLFGEYGADDYYGLLSKSIFKANRTDYEKYLSEAFIHKSHGVGGFGSTDHEYYAQGQIDYRNINAKYYFFQRKYHLVYELITLNEKIKLGTKTYGGQDRERSIIDFTSTAIENLAIQANGNKVGIEETRTGEIIPFANGEVLTRLNTQPPMPWGAAFKMGFLSTYFNGGFINWDAPNSYLGEDATKIKWYSDQQIKWRPTGSNTFQTYVSGQNGAPVTSSDGLINSLFSSVTDAMIAGRDALWPYRDRMQNVRFAPYISSRGSFTPTPGSTGHHLNGHGPVNWGQFTQRDIYEQKKGAAFRSDGMVVYINEYLPANLYEDNVTIAGVNLGRVYGGQIAIGILNSGA